MTSRPKAVSFIAICFALIAAATAFSDAYVFIIDELPHRAPLLMRRIIFLGIPLLYAFVARGLWRLSPTSRIMAMCLAPIDTLYLAYALYIDRTPDMEVPERIGYIFAAMVFVFCFSSPLYFLTRPAIASAFTKPNNT